MLCQATDNAESERHVVPMPFSFEPVFSYNPSVLL